MNKLILILLMTGALAGCPATFNANIKNESSGHIVVIPPFKSDY